MKLIFELGVEGRGMTLMPECDVPEYQLPEERSEALHLPHVSENELTRHYTALCKRIHGVNDGFYPLGSCTMKYNPKIDEDMAALPGFTQLHPLQSIETAQGALEALHTLGAELGEVFGMDTVTFQPAAGAHGEVTGGLLIQAHHTHRGDTARPKNHGPGGRPAHPPAGLPGQPSAPAHVRQQRRGLGRHQLHAVHQAASSEPGRHFPFRIRQLPFQQRQLHAGRRSGTHQHRTERNR